MRKLKNEELNRKTIESFKNASKNSLIIILDNVRSLNNIGSVFRTSDSFLIEKIYLCGITASPPHRNINKTALEKFNPEENKKYAFIFGNEVYGVNQNVVDLCNQSIEIPQFGTKHSLNISVAVGIVIWDFIKKKIS